jgi:cell wall-associated NlpC family hydrolase
VVYNKNVAKTKQCPICRHLTGKYKGFNCIRFVFTCWFHAGIPVKHEGGLVNNGIAEKMYKASLANALKLAQNALDCKDIKILRNKNGIPQSQMQPGDACMVFKGNEYKHFFLYAGNGKMIDCGRYGSDAKEIAERKAQTCQMIIRYTGK